MSEAAPGAGNSNGTGTDSLLLDDPMLATDTVDTPRRRERLVACDPDEAGRMQDLEQRLKRICAQQGIDLSDPVIQQGVAALREDRFSYCPPESGLARRLALLYVSRGRWGKWLAGALAAALLAWTVHFALFVAPDSGLPALLDEAHARVLELTHGDPARAVAQQIHAAGRMALDHGQPHEAKSALARLDRLRVTLAQEYFIRIVNRPGERSGIWRIPDVNRDARTYYLIVEAVDPTGKRLTVPVVNEETGHTEEVGVWGVRVAQATFEAVSRDRQDDGIIDDDRLGFKARGRIAPTYLIPVSGGAITRW